MNKYYGLLELRNLAMPCIQWREFSQDISFNSDCLWTVRAANQYGMDIPLPCKLGISSDEMQLYASALSAKYDLVIVSEYFFASISGVLLISLDEIIIEWTYGDSQRLTRHGYVEETMQLSFQNNTTTTHKLDGKIVDELTQYARSIRYRYRDELLSSRVVVLEWSVIAPNRTKAPSYHYLAGDLIFYDFRIA